MSESEPVSRLDGIRLGLWRLRPRGAWARRFGLSIVVGVLAGLIAAALEHALHFGATHLVGRFTHVADPKVFEFRWGVLLMPMIGGVITGVLLHLLAPGMQVSGVAQVTRAFHRTMGRLGLRRPIVAGLGATATISFGGSAGIEGPITSLGAAIGSAFGRFMPLTAQDRRVLLVAGAAAGAGAMFRCPLGGALFATSILYRDPEFEGDALVSSVVASVMGYSTMMLFHPAEALFPGVSELSFDSPAELLPYAILGPLCGVMSILFAICVTTVTRAAQRSKLPAWSKPALGGLATGAIACLLPQVMDGRYEFFRNALDGSLYGGADPEIWRWAGLFAAIAIGKCVATAFTVGSGAPGGVVGPSVAIGGATGAALGMLVIGLFPGAYDADLRDSLIPVAMGGVLAATEGAPLAAVVMVTEMTQSYGLIAPSMLVCVSSYLVGRRWCLNHEQVRSVAESPAHAADPIVHMLETWRVDQLMERDWSLTIGPNEGLDELAEQIEPGTRPVFAVSREGRLEGLISVPDICEIATEHGLAGLLVASDVMTPFRQLLTVRADDDLYSALTLFQRTGHDVLPVVGRRGEWLGMLSRRRVTAALREQLSETRASVLEEHRGLAAISRDLQMQQLMLMAGPASSDRVQRLFVPIDLIGQTLRTSDFRQRYGATVIAIETPDNAFQCPPDLDLPLHTGLRLLVIVEEKRD